MASMTKLSVGTITNLIKYPMFLLLFFLLLELIEIKRISDIDRCFVPLAKMEESFRTSNDESFMCI